MRAVIDDPPRPPSRPTVADILSGVARLRAPSTMELCGLLWPSLPVLPRVPGEPNARLTPFRWMINPPLPDGRIAWDAPAADWLWCELEALVKAGKLERSPEGEHPFVDALRTQRYRLSKERAELHRKAGERVERRQVERGVGKERYERTSL